MFYFEPNRWYFLIIFFPTLKLGYFYSFFLICRPLYCKYGLFSFLDFLSTAIIAWLRRVARWDLINTVQLLLDSCVGLKACHQSCSVNAFTFTHIDAGSWLLMALPILSYRKSLMLRIYSPIRELNCLIEGVPMHNIS